MRSTIVVLLVFLLAGCRSPSVSFNAKPYVSGKCVDVPWQTFNSTSNDVETCYSIHDLVEIAISNNPRIKEARHRIQVLEHRIPQVLSLPDPMVNTTTHLAPVETAAGRQAFGLGVSQKFTNVDRRATKAAIVYEEVRSARADLAQIEQEVVEQVRIAALQLLLIRETIRIKEEDLESLSQIEEVILREYEVRQDVSQQDVLNVQIERSGVENELTNIQQKEKSYRARLARLVKFQPDNSFCINDSLSEVAHYCDADTLIAQALECRPELHAQIALLRRDRRKICLAKLQNKPDFTVGVNWIVTSINGISPVANGNDAVLLGVGFNLPIYKDRIRAAVCEAEHSSSATVARIESLQDQIAEEVFDTVAKLESTGTTLELLQSDIIPKAERTLELSLEEYSKGKTDYTRLIESWRSILRYRIALANLKSQRMQLIASLSRQVGQLEPVGACFESANSLAMDSEIEETQERDFNGVPNN